MFVHRRTYECSDCSVTQMRCCLNNVIPFVVV